LERENLEKQSIAPDGTEYEIPSDERSQEEIKRIRKIVEKQKEEGKKIVVVQGLGFVGAVNAAVISNCEVDDEYPYYVIGVDLPTENSFWKVEKINNAESPFNVEDPRVQEMVEDGRKNDRLRATWVKEAYSLADIVIVDINLDVKKKEKGDIENFDVNIGPFENAMKDLGKNIDPDTLILVETTVPPGTTEKIIKPIIEEELEKRGIEVDENPPMISHSYERVMPGEKYVDSIINIWRTYSGINERSDEQVENFLSNLINTEDYPLWKLRNPVASEMAKILENSYRAMNIAFIYEWTLMAEDVGVNLFEVVDSISVRDGTHDNMMYPGFGVGGYCLPEDPLLGEWASQELFGRDEELSFSKQAVKINDLMPLHTYDLVEEGLLGYVKDKKICVLGASYRKDVDDTRNSPTVTLYDEIVENGGEAVIHDPYADAIEGRDDIEVHDDLEKVLSGSDAVVFVQPHKKYLDLPMDEVISNIEDEGCVVDAFNILDDQKIKHLKEEGLRVLGVGKGHIRYL